MVALVNRYLWDYYYEKRRQTIIPRLLRDTVALGLFLVALLLVLSIGYEAQTQLKGLLAGSGVIAIILGFAAQNLLSGMLAGMSLQIGPPYRLGDWLKLGEQFGEVVEINWGSTKLRTNDGISLEVPNNEIIKQTIINLHYPDAAARDAHHGGRRLRRAAESRQRRAHPRHHPSDRSHSRNRRRRFS